MAEELRTEEEQLDAIKRWWKGNGTSLLAGIAIAAAGVFGWKAWQNHQDTQREAASVRYEQLIQLVGQQDMSDQNRKQASTLIEEIDSEHGNTLYADLAHLVQARLAVEAGEQAQASQALQQLINNSKRPYVQGLARLNLARVQLEQGNGEQALDTLKQQLPETLAAQAANVRGDALVVLGRRDEARQAYQQALTLSEQSDQPIYGVQLKLDDLAPQEAS
ncbi:YfgM family protein [Phytohalomonas tamaricis]|uniref:YfgM family protein n=1 Tax=Phytohalomonas tamaricis TaxID=2081032 RepID=UPI000D0BBF22|nr:tetratricopeptide repeat protein [Phytohalomonas tamaricis]